MSIAVFNLRRMARGISLLILGGSGACIAAGLLVHPQFHVGTAVFTPLLLGDLWSRYIQRRHAILRNFGLFGAMRYALESLGPELRQYWIASDTEERPFSRRERNEVYRFAKDSTVKSAAFGTQGKKLDEGTIRHSMFPLKESDLEPFSLTFGEERGCPTAFTIDKPFMISAMSFGSLGEAAVRALSRGALQAGIPINSGEGGFPKHHLREGPNVIFQMGTAKFGCRNSDASLNEDQLRELAAQPQVKMIEVKFSQGAKPGKGGLLPAAKVTKEISELRGVPMGKSVYSPSSHVECDTPDNTAAFIKRVQEVSGLPVGMKLCLGRADEMRDLVAAMKRLDAFPDYMSIDGCEGGTGAAPAAFMDHVGIPLFPALQMTTEVLESEGVRDRLKLLAAGKLVNPARQIRAFASGADAVYTARGFMLALGCIQALQCNTGHCPVGITTHDKGLQRGLDLDEKALRVSNYARNLEHTLTSLLAATGKRSFHQLTRDDLFLPSEPLEIA